MPAAGACGGLGGARRRPPPRQAPRFLPRAGLGPAAAAARRRGHARAPDSPHQHPAPAGLALRRPGGLGGGGGRVVSGVAGGWCAGGRRGARLAAPRGFGHQRARRADSRDAGPDGAARRDEGGGAAAHGGGRARRRRRRHLPRLSRGRHDQRPRRRARLRAHPPRGAAPLLRLAPAAPAEGGALHPVQDVLQPRLARAGGARRARVHGVRARAHGTRAHVHGTRAQQHARHAESLRGRMRTTRTP